MREGWREVTIGDLGQIVTGNTPPKNDPLNYGGEYPFIKPTDMEIGRRYCTSWEENYSEKAFKRYKNSYIPPKSTGVVTIGTVGDKLFQADRWCFTNQSVNVVIPNTELYDEDFIYYLMKINLPKVENANPGTASGRHHVSKSNFCAIKVQVPINKETQKKIATILSGYDDLIENNLKRIKILEEMAQQTYEEWFVRMRFPGYENVTINEETGLPEGWKKVKLGDEFIIKNGKSFKGLNSGNTYENKIYGSNGIIGYSNLFNTRNSVIIGRVGAYCGSINYCSEDYWATDNTIYVEEKFNNISIELAYFILKQLNLRTYAGGSAQPLLTQNTINQLEIIKPNKDLIIKFSENCKNINKQILNLQNQNQRLREARDILLPRLMMGMIEV